LTSRGGIKIISHKIDMQLIDFGIRVVDMRGCVAHYKDKQVRKQYLNNAPYFVGFYCDEKADYIL
jgi:hypothetical protein